MSDIPIVDIIVPIYSGLNETRECLDSVSGSHCTTQFRLVLVNDASPETALVDYVETWAARNSATLITHDLNKGFSGAVNIGFLQNRDRDVVILNSDTRVHGDWLDRLRNCAYALEETGTVTPFSNNGTICGYPAMPQANQIPSGTSARELDEICARVNAGLQEELPTGVGFCMYIRRDCLQQVGLFDEHRFPRGYGEEVDFCLRAGELGFRHFLCPSVFVYHHGGVSFGKEARSLSDAAQETLAHDYPKYLASVDAFLRTDPLDYLRQRVSCARLQALNKPIVLFLTHDQGGGTEQHVQDLARLLSESTEVLKLRCLSSKGLVEVQWWREPEALRLFFSMPGQYQDLLEMIRALGISRVHYHHLLGQHPVQMRLADDLGIPYDFTVHDYFVICSNYTLTQEDGRYCGEPLEAQCNDCFRECLPDWPVGLTAWRAVFEPFLMGADRIICPSKDAQRRILRYYPGVNTVAWSHPEVAYEPMACEPVRAAPFCRVLVLGAVSREKGAFLLEACAKDAKQRSLPLTFRVLGTIKEPVSMLPEAPLSVSGAYENGSLMALIEQERADMVFFPCLWPETYSYTLSAAMASGLPIAAPDIGAFTERLEHHAQVLIADWNTPAAEWNDLLVRFGRTLGVLCDAEKEGAANESG